MADLVIRCLQGDNQACALLVQQHALPIQGAIKRTLSRYTGQAAAEEVEDLFHECYLHLCEDNWRRLRKFRGKSSIATYLGVLAANHVVDGLRKRKDFIPLDDEELHRTLASPNPSPDRQLELTEAEQIVKECMDGLKPKEMLLLKLLFFEELRPAAVSSMLGISAKAVSDRKSRLVDKLKNCAERRGMKRL